MHVDKKKTRSPRWPCLQPTHIKRQITRNTHSSNSIILHINFHVHSRDLYCVEDMMRHCIVKRWRLTWFCHVDCSDCWKKQPLLFLLKHWPPLSLLTSTGCPETVDIANGVKTETGDRIFNPDRSQTATVSYRCNQGYTLVGDMTLFCTRLSGQTRVDWSPAVPRCELSESLCTMSVAADRSSPQGSIGTLLVLWPTLVDVHAFLWTLFSALFFGDESPIRRNFLFFVFLPQFSSKWCTTAKKKAPLSIFFYSELALPRTWKFEASLGVFLN